MSGFSNWYKAGTVTVTNGSAVVTGSGTAWTTIEVRPGDVFLTDGTRLYEILTVDSATQITLAGPWAGTTASGQTYGIIRNFSVIPGATLVQEQIDIIRQLRTYLEQHYEWQTAPAAAPGDPATTVTFTNWNGTTAEYESLPQLIESLTGVHWDDIAGVPATFPPAPHTHPEITGALGSIASQNASSVSVTGGSISGVNISNSPVGSTTPSTGIFTALSALSLKIRTALGLISTDTTAGSDSKQITLTGGGDAGATRGGSVTVYGAQAGARAGGVDINAVENRDIQLNTTGTGSVKVTGRVESNRSIRAVSTHPTDSEVALFDRSELNTDDAIVRIRSGNQGKTTIQFEDDDSATVGAIGYDHALNRVFIRAGETVVAVIDTAGMQVLVPLSATGLTNLTGTTISGATINNSIIGQTTPAAGFFTTISGALTGNASTATRLQTARSISLTGRANGSATFDGSANVSLNVTSLTVDGSQVTTGTVAAARGGTGQTTYTIGDILAASSSSVLAKIAPGQSGLPFISNGTGVLPSYQALNLAGSGVTGNLPVSRLNGGLNASSSRFWRGDGTWAPITVAFSSVTGVTLAGATSGHLLRFNGTTWLPGFLTVSDIPELAASKITSGVLPAARLGSGTATASTALFGDGQWKTISGGTWGSISGSITAQTDLVNYINGLNFNASRINAGVFAAARLANGTPVVGQVPVVQANGSVSWTTVSGSGAPLAWGNITGTLSNQTDLQSALNTKAAVDHDHPDATTSQRGFMTTAQVQKLNTIAPNATANSPDATLLSRANHTGTQPISSVVNLQNQLDAKMPAGASIPFDTTSNYRDLSFVTADSGGNPFRMDGETLGDQILSEINSADFRFVSVTAGSFGPPEVVVMLGPNDHMGRVVEVMPGADSAPRIYLDSTFGNGNFGSVANKITRIVNKTGYPLSIVNAASFATPAFGDAGALTQNIPVNGLLTIYTFNGYYGVSREGDLQYDFIGGGVDVKLPKFANNFGFDVFGPYSVGMSQFQADFGGGPVNTTLSLGSSNSVQGSNSTASFLAPGTVGGLASCTFTTTANGVSRTIEFSSNFAQPNFIVDDGMSGYNSYPMLHTGNVKTINGVSIFGSGNISVSGGGGGTVTSIGLTASNIFNVTNTPITSSGNISLTLANQSSRTFLAAPDGFTGTPSFRAITVNDVPVLGVAKISLGTTSRLLGSGTGASTGAALTLGAGFSMGASQLDLQLKTVNGQDVRGVGDITISAGPQALLPIDYWVDEVLTSGNTTNARPLVMSTFSFGSVTGNTASGNALIPVGVIFNSSASGANGGGAYATDQVFQLGVGSHAQEILIATPSSLQSGLQARIGLTDSNTTTINKGVYFRILNGTLYGITAVSGASFTADTVSVTLAANTIYLLRLEVNAAGNSARFRVFSSTGSTLLDRTITTTIPTGLSNLLRVAGVISNSNAASAQLLAVSRVGFGTINGLTRARG